MDSEKSSVYSDEQEARVHILKVDGTISKMKVESATDMYGFLPSGSYVQGKSFIVGDLDQQVSGQMYILYDCNAFSANKRKDKINLHATRLLMDTNKLEPPRVFDSKNVEDFLSTLPIGDVVLYSFDQKTNNIYSLADGKRQPDKPRTFANIGGVKDNYLYNRLATERYSHFSQALQEYLDLEDPAKSQKTLAALVVHYLKEQPRLTGTQIDRLRCAILGAAVYMMNRDHWPLSVLTSLDSTAPPVHC